MTAGLTPAQDTGARGAQAQTEGVGPGYVTGIADGNLATPVRLRDYLTGVGVVFRLPKRDRKKEKAEADAKEAARFRFRIPVKQIFMVLAPVMVAGAAYLVWDSFLSSVPLPETVSGTWTTRDGKYAGRNFWISKKSVAFQNGAKIDQFSIHPIKRIKTRTSADTLFLNVDYEQEGKPITLLLAYRESPQPEIHLVNQPKIRWVKIGKAPVIEQ
jgi:hypothetical protein